jgi:translocation and assembly module TamB
LLPSLFSTASQKPSQPPWYFLSILGRLRTFCEVIVFGLPKKHPLFDITGVKLLKSVHSFLCRRRKAIFLALTAGGLALAFSSCFLLLLPTLLSSDPVQRQLHLHLENVLGRTVEWEHLDFSWRRGMRLSGLQLGEGTAPLRRMQLKTLEAAFGLTRGEHRLLLLSLDLRLSGLTVHLDSVNDREIQPAEQELTARAAAPPSIDPEEMLAGLAAGLQDAIGFGWDLPVDVRLMVNFGEVAVHYRDHRSGETLSVEDFHLTLNLPSLLSQPIDLAAGANLQLNGNGGLPLDFRATIGDLASGNGRLRPAGAQIVLAAELPGLRLGLEGGLEGKGLEGRAHLEPFHLLPLVQPFLTGSLPQVTGYLTVSLRGEILEAGNLAIHLAVQGEELSASGGPVNGRAGPLSFAFSQQVATDHPRDTVSFPEGVLSVPEILEARWQAAVEQPLSPARKVSADFGPLIIHLAPIISLATPLLPADLPSITGEGRLELDSLVFTAEKSGETGEMDIRGLRLLLDRFDFLSQVVGANLLLEVTGLAVSLADGLPESARLETGLQIGALQWNGEQPLTISHLAGQAAISLEELRLRPESRFGFAARFAIDQQFSLASLNVPGIIQLLDLEEELQVGLHTDERGDLYLDLQSLAVLAQGRPMLEGRLLPPLSLELLAQGSRVVSVENEPWPRIHDLDLRLQLEPGLHLTARAEMAPEQDGTARSEGRLVIDLAGLSAWAKDLLPKGAAGEGRVELTWRAGTRMAGVPPAEAEVINPLRQAREILNRLTETEVSLDIQGGSFLLGEMSPLAATRINTPEPLRLRFSEGARSATLEMVGTVDKLTELSGSGDGFPPQKLYLVLKGKGTDLATFHLAQEMRLEPAGLKQIAELDFANLDLLADFPGVPGPAELLRLLNGSLSASLHLPLANGVAGRLPGKLAGDFAAGIRVDLQGGKQLQVQAFGDLDDLHAHLADGSQVEGLNFRLNFHRLFTIGDRQKVIPRHAWLSETVFDDDAPKPVMAAPRFADRLWQDLRGADADERSLTFSRAKAMVAGFPIELSAGEGSLNLDGVNPGINYLQMGVMGGSLRARAGLDLTAAMPRAELFCSFSNLDTARLRPEKRTREGSGASEITGELTLKLPLVEDSRQLLEELDLRLNLWRIGSRTLEEALFALDPHEQNEAIIRQRKMLRSGSLRRLRLTAADGGLSMAGEIVAGGIGIDLPRLDRLNLTSLPLEEMLSGPLKSLPSLFAILDLAAANHLEIGAGGEIALKRKPTEENP